MTANSPAVILSEAKDLRRPRVTEILRCAQNDGETALFLNNPGQRGFTMRALVFLECPSNDQAAELAQTIERRCAE